ncbi:MAG TPA: flagellin [Solirubrobacteraceae bacterium]|nr:flagellin [Solirubrobacteraceae bacterium]
MALYVNTNSEAIIAQDNLNTTESALNMSMTDLSSGLRINTAADDAAGYAISEDLTSQVNGLNQSSDNAQDATALIQTADGALNDVEQMLQTVRELTVEYNSGTLDSTDQNAIISEVTQLVCQIEQIGSQAQFNGINLFSPSGTTHTATLSDGLTVNYSTLTFQVGANDGQTISISLVQLAGNSGILNNIEKLVTGGTINSTSVSLGSVGNNGTGALSLISDAIDQVSALAADFGAVQNRLSYTLDNLSTYSENLNSAQATITDVDMASEETEFTKDQILEQAGISMLSQAEQNPQAVLKLLGG